MSRRLLAAALLAGAAVLAGAGPAGADAAGAAARRAPHPTLVAAGDIACAPSEPRTADACRQADTAALVARLRPDVVAPLGDLQYWTGHIWEFERAYHPTWGRFLRRTRPALGNHEYGTPGAAGYFAYFGRRGGPRGRGWYSYDLGRWHVVVLNTNCHEVDCSAGSRQARWLRADLAAHPTRCTLAYGHHPRYSSGPHGSDGALAPLWRVLHEAGAELVLAGHDHLYERFAPQDADGNADPARGVVQMVVGTGGSNRYAAVSPQPLSLARGSVFGVLELTLRPRGWSWRFAGEPGAAFRDAGSARCR